MKDFKHCKGPTLHILRSSNLEQKNKAGGITIPDFKVYHTTIAIKTAQYRHKNRNIDQWNKIKSLEIHTHIYVQLLFSKDAKNS